MTLDDVPALAVVALCLRELRGMRLGLELALAQLRADLRTVLGLLAPQGVGRALEPGSGLPPSLVGHGASDQGEGAQEVGGGLEKVARVEEHSGSGRVAEHRASYRPTG